MLNSHGTSRHVPHSALLSGAVLLLLTVSACGVAEGTTAAPTPSIPIPPTREPAPTSAPQVLVQPTSVVRFIGPPVKGTPSLDGSSIQAPAATGVAFAGAWQIYRSDQAGYTAEYPKEWSVEEQGGTNGTARSIVTTFRPTDGGARIIVTTLIQTPDQAEPLDMPNTHCQQVQGNRGIATRCLDTISRATSTTIVAQGKTYTIASAGKDMNQTIYQHILDSFAPFATPAAQAGADLESLLFQPGDLPDGIAARHADNPSPLNFEDNPPAATMVGLSFTQESRGAGGVSLLLYTSAADLASAYSRLTTSVLNDEAAAGTKPQPKPGVGEQARAARLTLASSTYGKGTVSVIIFTRCHALVDIRLNEWAGMTLETAAAYATALDTRLTAKVCQ
jgi:hypothetical protein